MTLYYRLTGSDHWPIAQIVDNVTKSTRKSIKGQIEFSGEQDTIFWCVGYVGVKEDPSDGPVMRFSIGIKDGEVQILQDWAIDYNLSYPTQTKSGTDFATLDDGDHWSLEVSRSPLKH
ncbi:MAG: hypothetical protein AAFP77_07195 [Bacteroidota bacterium]